MSLEIIAEAAQGYLADPVGRTRLLVDCAAAAGADAVKFQLVYADEICTPDHEHFGLFGRLEIPDADWQAVADRSRERRIRLYLDVFGERSLELACRIGADGLKLHSTDVLNLPLIRRVAACPLSRVILSSGGTFELEISEAVETLAGKKIVLMHGFQGYPTELGDNQVSRLQRLRERYPTCELGFADHVPEDEADRFWLATVAVGAGATVIEKHLTTALALKEEDHEAALNPDEFSLYGAAMRRAHAAYGVTGPADDFGMSEAERVYRRKTKKHVVASRPLKAGTLLGDEDLALKRTNATESVFRDLREVEGRRLRNAVATNRPIQSEDLA